MISGIAEFQVVLKVRQQSFAWPVFLSKIPRCDDCPHRCKSVAKWRQIRVQVYFFTKIEERFAMIRHQSGSILRISPC